VLVLSMLDAGLNSYHRLELDNAAIIRFAYRDGNPVLITCNEHAPSDERQ
jgi:hypothetical protein